MHNVMVHRLEPRHLGFIFLVACFVYIMLCETSFNHLLKTISSIDTTKCDDRFAFKIVHFDLKGAPLKPWYFSQIFPLLKLLDIRGVLLEYEDMFPYSGKLEILRRENAYSESELKLILETARENDLEVIPLVQTFGHMEFVLKHDKYSYLRENPIYSDTICPSANESWNIITEMISQIRASHPTSNTVHIGADEALHIAADDRCRKRLRPFTFTIDDLKLDHISRIARFAKKKGFKNVMTWNDMFANISSSLLLKYEMNKLIIPVIWGYATNVTALGYFPIGMFARFSKVFDNVFFGSAFKGANGIRNIFMDINRYLNNHRSYVQLYEHNEKYLKGKLSGIILTGWQRYNHFSPLCELLPVGIPSLVVNALYMRDTSSELKELVHVAKKILGCKELTMKQIRALGYNHPSLETLFLNCSFSGQHIFDIVERLRLLQWKTDELLRDASAIDKSILIEKLNKVESELRSAMHPFFYNDTIDEFVGDNVIAVINKLKHYTSTVAQ